MRGWLRTISIALVLLAGTSSWARSARANGRFPAAGQLIVSPESPDRMVLRATFGLLFTSDRGVTWDWLCERGVGYGGEEDPALGITGDGTLIATLEEGLAISSDRGCAWKLVGGTLDKRAFIDVVVRGGTAEAIALASGMGSSGDAAPRAGARLFATTDGTSWEPLGGELDPTLAVETVEIATSDSSRVYVSGWRPGSAAREGVVLTSMNGGASFVEHVVPLDPLRGEQAPFVSGVDPSNADRVYVRIRGSSGDRLLVSDSGGASFRSVFSGTGLLGFALSSDGAKVYVGGREGLFVADRETLAFDKRASFTVQCLTVSGSSLFACSNEASSGFALGISDDDGRTFTQKYRLAEIRGPLGCAPETSGAICKGEWPVLRNELGIAFDGGADDAPPDTAARDVDGGCDVARSSPAGALVLSLLGLALVFARGRRGLPPRGPMR